MRLIVTIVTLVLMSLPAAAKVPFFPKNTPYHEARPRLLAMGYTPVKLKPKSRYCPDYHGPCTLYPEAEACSGIGDAPCTFLWRSKARELIEISTEGEVDYMTIKKVRCRANCKKSTPR